MHAAWLDWVRASAFITAASAADPSSWDDVWHAAGKYASASGPSIALPAHLPHPQLWWGASNFASSPIRCHFSYFSHKLSALFSLSLSLSPCVRRASSASSPQRALLALSNPYRRRLRLAAAHPSPRRPSPSLPSPSLLSPTPFSPAQPGLQLLPKLQAFGASFHIPRAGTTRSREARCLPRRPFRKRRFRWAGPGTALRVAL